MTSYTEMAPNKTFIDLSHFFFAYRILLQPHFLRP